MTEFYPPSPDQEQPLRVPALLQMLGRTAMYGYTELRNLRNHPPTFFEVIEKDSIDSPQPLHPDLGTVGRNLQDMLARHTISDPQPLSLGDKLMRSARMVQFTNRLLSNDYAFFEYDTMKTLKERFVDTAQQQRHPLGFDQQLDIALDLADDDIMQALTTLWFASRQYSRWLDGASIQNLPSLTAEEIMTEMRDWRSSIFACKNADTKNFQDTAGDCYYAWTHARARVMYGTGTGLIDSIGKLIFKHGTTMNTHVRVIKQRIPSNHKKAAAYGNRIGDVILDAIEKK